MRTLIFLFVSTLFLYACNHKETTTVTPTPPNPLVTDKVVGSYIGTNLHIMQTNTGSNGTYRDTIITADTFVIAQIGNTDSFKLVSPEWTIADTGFKYDGSASYYRKSGNTGWNDNFNELTITFDKANHKLKVERHHVMVNSWIMEDWDVFAGN